MRLRAAVFAYGGDKALLEIPYGDRSVENSDPGHQDLVPEFFRRQPAPTDFAGSFLDTRSALESPDAQKSLLYFSELGKTPPFQLVQQALVNSSAMRTLCESYLPGLKKSWISQSMQISGL